MEQPSGPSAETMCGSVCLLSDRPELSDQVFALLQQQWPIHDATRRRGLAPHSAHDRVLLLSSLSPDVIGHAQLKWVTEEAGATAVGMVVSVVVHPAWRRRHVGRQLMDAVEAIASRRHHHRTTTLYLWTADQERFFGRVGYTKCPPFEGSRSGLLGKTAAVGLARLLHAKLAQTSASRGDDIETSSHGDTWMRKMLEPTH
ncbi:Aste57867_21900 [Aphanomyces stellatus]|uniref:Aste57867_21900 protein n=1 Tax=Aphanomyces stellatus TaxID=120398 RepID=A0A485LKU0_9STRA|nr:hypothetical protein As57867_021831 [Aphanomyces stellatus]VFT98568.1 Aste57867_21900 [Aphanomyces stellatus]